MKQTLENREYLTDAELEQLILEIEQNDLVPAAQDLGEMILEALEAEKKVSDEQERQELKGQYQKVLKEQYPKVIQEQEVQGQQAQGLTVLKEERRDREKLLEFKRYRFRVLTTVVAAVLLVFLLPKFEDLQQPGREWGKLLTKYEYHEYMSQNRYESKEEALNDSSILENMLGGVNIFAENSRLNLFRD